MQMALVLYSDLGRGKTLAEFRFNPRAPCLAGCVGLAQRRITATMASKLPNAARP